MHVKHCRAVENGRKVEEALLNTFVKLTEFPIGQTRIPLKKLKQQQQQQKYKKTFFFPDEKKIKMVSSESGLLRDCPFLFSSLLYSHLSDFALLLCCLCVVKF